MSTARISGHFILALLCAPLLMGGACEKKTTKPNDTGAISAMDRAGSNGSAGASTVAGEGGPVDTTPLPGIDVSKLDADHQALFYKLIGSFKSPCGKAHSLRTSFSSDTSCKRAPYAVKYVVALLEDEAPESDLRELYTKRYETPRKKVTLDVSKAAHLGPDDAPIRLVEFFDYECPHCQAFAKVLPQLVEREASKGIKISEYFMMFPLSGHPESRSAARAAVAALQMGKFEAMHAMLFAKSPEHGRDAVIGYAKELGLDPAKFETLYTDAEAQVASDLKQGTDTGVDATPTLFINDYKYEGPSIPKYIDMYIDEELAVNR